MASSPMAANSSLSSFVQSPTMSTLGLQGHNGTASSTRNLVQSAPATTQSSPTSAIAPRDVNNGLPALTVETSFYHGVPTSSNLQTLYIQVAAAPKGGVDVAGRNGQSNNSNNRSSESNIDSSNASTSDTGSGFWVSCPWQDTIKKMVEHPNLVYTLMNGIKNHPTMKHKVLKILNGENSSGSDHSVVGGGGMGIGDFNLPPSPTMTAANTQNLNLFSPNGNDSPGSLWSAAQYENGHPHFRTVPGTPMTGGFPDSGQSSAGSPASISANYSSPWSMSGNHFDSLSLAAVPSTYNNSGGMPSASIPPVGSNTVFSAYPSVVTAAGDTIDPSILAQVESNLNQEEYIWSPADTSLYEVGNARAIQAMSLPGAIRMVFPPNTMIMAWEKDGSLASPAFRPLHPHSNQWLKAQVCDRRCAYRAGTSSLKRPITIRDHFRKCVYLDDHHPLKLLCTLELAAHERASQGLLPNRRRTRGARLGVKTSVEPPSPKVTRATRPFPVTRGSSVATNAGAAAPKVKAELGSPFSGPADGNDSETERVGNTSTATSGRDDSSHAANESDGDFSMEKAPRSLRGITTIAEADAAIPSGLGNGTASSQPSSAYASPAQTPQHYFPYHREGEQHFIHPASYMMHTRRHTVPDASRSLFSGGGGSVNPTGPESIAMDTGFRPAGFFASGNDLQAQYGGLFYSAASSNMVGLTRSLSSPSPTTNGTASCEHASTYGAPREQHQPPFTVPTTPSTALNFNVRGQDMSIPEDSTPFFIPFLPDLDSKIRSSAIDTRDLLSSYPSYPSSPSGQSHSDDNTTFSPFSSNATSPSLHDVKIFGTGASPLEPKLYPEPQPAKQSISNRFFGAHHSQLMDEDSDSPFTTDFSSSEDEVSYR